MAEAAAEAYELQGELRQEAAKWTSPVTWAGLGIEQQAGVLLCLVGVRG